MPIIVYLSIASLINCKNLEERTKSYENPPLKNNKVLNLDPKYHYNEKDLEKFNSWVIETLEESKRDSTYAIIVNKSEYLLYLIKNGEVYSKYWIELGTNPFDDKKRRGDRCTPEGKYYIAKKKRWSIFYKALLLSYPSIEDAKEGLKMKLIDKKTFNRIVNAILNKRIPDQNTRLGGLIEIHGCGSGWPGNKGGYNWTWGCIAVSNYAIDEIFPLVKDGAEPTKVTIVRYTTVLK